MEHLEEGWEKFYHKSAMREGIISWYDFRKNSRVLEWNGGRGELTRCLSDHCEEVTCVVEHSGMQKKAEEYCHDKKNVKVILREEIDQSQRYDYLIAVEPFYPHDCDKVVQETFYVWKKMLGDKGILLLIVTNLIGISNLIGIDSGKKKQFDRWKLKDLLSSIYSKIKFYYLYPDYIYPQVIYTEKRPPDYDIVESIIPYAQNIGELNRDGIYLYRTLAKYCDLRNHASSFLVECSVRGVLSEIIGAKVTSERGECSIATILREDKVEKRPLNQPSRQQLRRLAENMSAIQKCGISVLPFEYHNHVFEMPYSDMKKLSSYLKEIVCKSQFEFLNCLDSFFAQILMSSKTVSAEKNILKKRYGDLNWGPVLQSAYIEMTPLNCFYAGGKFIFYDQEYRINNIPASYVMYRALAHLYYFDEVFEQNIPLEIMKIRYGISETWGAFEQIETEFLERVRGGKENDSFFRTYSLFNQFKYCGEVPLDLMTVKHFFNNIQGKKVVCWGAATFFDAFMNTYGTVADIAFAVDNNENLWGTEIRGIPVKNPDTLKKGDYRVIITCDDYKSAVDQLSMLGIFDPKIYRPEG